MPAITHCKNCHSEDLYEAEVNGGGAAGSMLPLGALHGPRYEIVICGVCGHTDWFVSKEHLHLVKDKLRPVARN